jgi:hypothetical protein
MFVGKSRSLTYSGALEMGFKNVLKEGSSVKLHITHFNYINYKVVKIFLAF